MLGPDDAFSKSFDETIDSIAGDSIAFEMPERKNLMSEIINDLPLKEYLTHKAMSKSKLDLFARDENLLSWQLNCPTDEDKLKVFDFGTAMHAILLEPHKIESDYAVMPKYNLRTNLGKQNKADFEADNADKQILTSDDYKKLKLMFGSVMAHPSARKIIQSGGPVEQSFFWTDSESGVDCRCRTDKIVTEDNYIVDIKTVDDLSSFKYSVENYRYYVQDAFYLDGAAANGVVCDHMKFLVIQKNIEMGRYPVMVVTLPAEVTQYGRKTYKTDLINYAKYCEKQVIKPSQELELHHWFINKIYDEFVGGIQ